MRPKHVGVLIILMSEMFLKCILVQKVGFLKYISWDFLALTISFRNEMYTPSMYDCAASPRTPHVLLLSNTLLIYPPLNGAESYLTFWRRNYFFLI